MAGVEQVEVAGLKVVGTEPRGFVQIYLEQVHPQLEGGADQAEGGA